MVGRIPAGASPRLDTTLGFLIANLAEGLPEFTDEPGVPNVVSIHVFWEKALGLEFNLYYLISLLRVCVHRRM